MDLDLASFPPATRADWLKLVEGVLKGTPYDKRMLTRTADGYTLDALPERRREAAPIAGRQAGAPWKVIARIDHDDPAAANAQLLEDLDGGADGATLVFASAPSAGGFGLPVRHEELVQALKGVMPELITLRVEAGHYQGRDIALALARLYEKQDPAKLDIRFGLDPIGDFAALGAAPIEWDALSARLGQTVATLRARGLTSPMVRADGRLHHAAGRHRRAGVGRGARHRPRLSARLGSRRAVAGRCRRRHRGDAHRRCRPVRHPGQAARLPPALGGGAVRLRHRGQARRHPHGNGMALADPPRSSCEPAARHHCRLCGGCRRGGQRLGAALHAGARASRCRCAAARAQYAGHPDRGIEPPSRRRPFRRRGGYRGAHGGARRRSMGAVPPDRARGRHGREPHLRRLAKAHRRGAQGARKGRRHPPPSHYRNVGISAAG